MGYIIETTKGQTARTIRRAKMFNLTFISEARLRQWLEKKNFESGSGEAFCEWLSDFFDSGNTITVCGEEYDYWACWELV